MINNHISQYLQIFNKRIFLDIASDGCGSGCVYCFSKHPNNQQTYLLKETLDELCDHICKITNCKDYILSFCPNTEPMKSRQSRELVYHVIERMHSKVKFIQIATKELIPIDYLSKLDSLIDSPFKLRISISIPYLDNISLIEPHAATIEQRLMNIRNIAPFSSICSILYLRPFNAQMLQNRNRYVDIIETYSPDEICVGAEFVPKVDSQQLCTFMYDNNLAPAIFTRPDMEDIFDFVEFLRKRTRRKIFYSSVCNIANQSDYGCILGLDKFDHRYCTDCVMK